MNSKAPLVSVVTPFYNTQDYLSECIESVLGQTYTNWQYVLLNNCSSDKSVEVVERYEKLHPGKLRLEHNKEFLSQVGNYNQVLRFVSPESKYCKVLQADDWLFPQCLEMMVEMAERDEQIGIVGAYSIEGRTVEFDGIPHSTPILSGREVCRLFFLEDLYVFGSPTQLLVRSELVRERWPFYDEAHYPFEDAVVAFQLLMDCKFGFVHQVLTFSRRDNQSTMQGLLDIESPKAFRLLMLHEFGHAFLEPGEYNAQLAKKERIYAHLLVAGLVGRGGREFWKFHKDMLKRMGYTFKSPRAWWRFFVAMCGLVLNPKSGLSLLIFGLRLPKAR